MEYIVAIDNFNGPLDLLLHLLKKDNVKIEDISIEKITEQYLEYITKMEELNLDITSEYLVMAAELIEMKSYLLVPKKQIEEEEDPRQNLIEKLTQYKNYKEVTEQLKELEKQRAEIYTKDPTIIEIDDNTHESVDILVEAFKNFISRQELDKPLDTTIATKEYSVHERSIEIKTLLKRKKKIEFTELFDTMLKEYIVVTFLSILELSKKQELDIIQDNNFDKIYLINKGD